MNSNSFNKIFKFVNCLVFTIHVWFFACLFVDQNCAHFGIYAFVAETNCASTSFELRFHSVNISNTDPRFAGIVAEAIFWVVIACSKCEIFAKFNVQNAVDIIILGSTAVGIQNSACSITPCFSVHSSFDVRNDNIIIETNFPRFGFSEFNKFFACFRFESYILWVFIWVSLAV